MPVTSGYAEGQPRVRVVVLDHDGGAMTLACLSRILEVGSREARLEVVLVDNGSRRSVADEVTRRWPNGVEVRRSATNLGFAGGNNLALRDLDGVDFVALVNNDVTVGDAWLEPLLAALRDDPSLGAAGPKLLFDDHYFELQVCAPAARAGRGDRRCVGVRWYGVVDDGSASGGQLVQGFLGAQQDGRGEWFEWTATEAIVRVVDRDVNDRHTVRVRLGADHSAPITIRSGEREQRLEVRRGVHDYDVEVGGAPFDVVNNAGTVLLENWYGADRGFLERDLGQYDSAQDVTAWCGGAVLLRADYLRDAGVFDERLFLYYEDLELSLRGAKRGWRYRYEPRSVVRHRVGATSVHGSSLTERFKERNRLLVLLRHFPLRVAAGAAVRYLLSTASFARRDVIAPLLQRRKPSTVIVRNRLRAFGEFVVLAPSMWKSRLSRRSSIDR